MAKKKDSKKAAAKPVVETEAEVAPAIVEEAVIKVMQKGKNVRYMTQSEYNAEFAK